jgi:hypothetical protein
MPDAARNCDIAAPAKQMTTDRLAAGWRSNIEKSKCRSSGYLSIMAPFYIRNET